MMEPDAQIVRCDDCWLPMVSGGRCLPGNYEKKTVHWLQIFCTQTTDRAGTALEKGRKALRAHLEMQDGWSAAAVASSLGEVEDIARRLRGKYVRQNGEAASVWQAWLWERDPLRFTLDRRLRLKDAPGIYDPNKHGTLTEMFEREAAKRRKELIHDQG